MAVIPSILDTDLYKLTMAQAYFLKYNGAIGEYRFQDRKREKRTIEFLEKVLVEIKQLENLHLTDEEYTYLKGLGYFQDVFLDWLKTFRFDSSKVHAYLDEHYILNMTVVGPIHESTLYEIPLLAIASQLRNEEVLGAKPDTGLCLVRYIDKQKFATQHGLIFSEFGTRRRASFDVQEEIVKYIASTTNTCVGTSNVYLAMKYKLAPSGTMAHELFMFHAALFGFKEANVKTIDMWQEVYGEKLQTALIDTFTTKSFLSTITKEQAERLDAFRQDSGDEFEVGNMIIKRLEELGISPKEKTIVFSNALNFPKFSTIKNYFQGKVKLACAGIGTDITCDVPVAGFVPPSYVIKLYRCKPNEESEWIECVKCSDDEGKHFGSKEAYEKACDELGLYRLKNQPCYDKNGKEIGWLSRSCASVLFIVARDSDGVKRVLAAKRGGPDYVGYWNAPCGYLDYNETTKECAVREAKEECGVDIKTRDLEFIDFDDSPKANRQNVSFHYTTEIVDKTCEQITLSKALNEPGEVLDYKWVSLEEIDMLKWAFNHDKYIKAILQ